MRNGTIELKPGPMTWQDVVAVARDEIKVTIGAESERVMVRSRDALERIAADGEAHYGVNTGFGSLARHRVDAAELGQLQLNLIRSHAAGVGPPLPSDVVRGTMLLLAASLCRGASGASPGLVRLIVDMLNSGITPVIPETGSVGASGDLAPLAHLALSLVGEGRCVLEGQVLHSRDALDRQGLAARQLGMKEGLALINGTHLMAARACLVLSDARRLLRSSLVAGAMSLDGCRGSDAPFDARIAEMRGHPGVAVVSRVLRRLLEGSQIGPSHREGDPRVQDPYSLRCQPQVIGAAIDQLAAFRVAVERELGAVTDNPLLVDGGVLVSGGNFHGMPIAMPLDAVALPLAHTAGLSERRVFWMLAAIDPDSGLSPYLAKRPGLSSGLMIAQYTAAAACNEIVGLCTPASVANISTCAGVEDYNSFGPRGAAKAARIVELAEAVVAVELLCAAEAIDHQRPLRTGDRLEDARALIRAAVDPYEQDRPPGPDIEAVAGLIRGGAFDRFVESEGDAL
ncbi:MAG: histidine ammonia-lyase [Planctomycetota bacterium]